MKFASLFLFLGLAFASDELTAGSSDKITINVQQPNDQIRAQVLRYTPVGSIADDVIDFIQSRLYYEGVYGSDVGVAENPGVSVTLGHRNDNPPWGHSAVAVAWIFKDDLKLQDIQIRAVPQEGSYSHSQDPDLRPKIKINLHEPDNVIKQQILKYTPVGTDRGTVSGLIGTHLYFQGGLTNGQLLGGKSGSTGVILGHYFDDSISKEMSVRVRWEFDDDRVKDVAVWRTDSLRPVLTEKK